MLRSQFYPVAEVRHTPAHNSTILSVTQMGHAGLLVTISAFVHNLLTVVCLYLLSATTGFRAAVQNVPTRPSQIHNFHFKSGNCESWTRKLLTCRSCVYAPGPHTQWFPSPSLNPNHRTVNESDMFLWNIQSVRTVVWTSPFSHFQNSFFDFVSYFQAEHWWFGLVSKVSVVFLLSQDGAVEPNTSRRTGHLCSSQPTLTLGVSWSCKRWRHHSETGKLFVSDVRSSVYSIS